MATAVQKRRLIEAIAYIRTHRSKWNQGLWVDPQKTIGKCGTVGCLAGHIAITLNPSKPLIDVPEAVFKKRPAQRTPEEQRLVAAAYAFSEYVKPTKQEEQYVTDIYCQPLDKNVKGVHVKWRAARLLGDLIGSREIDTGSLGLFSGNNDMLDIYRIAASKLGITQTELKKQCAQIAAERGWGTKASA